MCTGVHAYVPLTNPALCMTSKHLCAAVPVCLCVGRPNLCMKQESVNGF